MHALWATLLTLLWLTILGAPARADDKVTSTTTDQNAPVLVVTADRMVNIYVTKQGGVSRVAYKISTDFTKFGNEVVIDLPAGFTSANQPAATELKNGDILITCVMQGPGGVVALWAIVLPKGQSTTGAMKNVSQFNSNSAVVSNPAAAADMSSFSANVYIAAEVDLVGQTGGGIVGFRSTDGGQTWSSPNNISTFAAFNKVPQIAVDSTGRTWVTWTDVFQVDKVTVSTSTNGGNNFTPPKTVTQYTSDPTLGPSPITLWWRTANSGNVFFTDCTLPTQCRIMTSVTGDGGVNWGVPTAIIPKPFDQRIMVGTAVNWTYFGGFFQQTGQGPLYDLFWTSTTDGQSWTDPIRFNDGSVHLGAVYGPASFTGGGTSIPLSIGVIPGPAAPPLRHTDADIPGTSLFPIWTGLSAVGNSDLFTAGASDGNLLVAAVLPTSRSVQVGHAATAFVTVINTGATPATDVGISMITAVPATFSYQTTDVSNVPTGTANTPVTIPAGGSQTFVIAITPTASFSPSDIGLNFAGSNTVPVRTVIGLNTLLGSGSANPVPDIVALAATVNNDGIVNIVGANGAGAFAVATVNVGAGGNIIVTADTGTASLPVSIALCQTEPATGACKSPPAANVPTTINAGETPTFAIFVSGAGVVAFDPANNRVFVRFADSGGVTRGSTSVAVRTQ